jgi:hypothetical protein
VAWSSKTVPLIRFTRRTIDAIPLTKEGQILYRDDELNGFGLPDWTIQHPTSPSNFSYSMALNPFQVVAQPVALAQLTVLPYTLLYMPSGNASKATFATTTSFGTKESQLSQFSGMKSWACEYRPHGGGRGVAKKRITLGKVTQLTAEHLRAR